MTSSRPTQPAPRSQAEAAGSEPGLSRDEQRKRLADLLGRLLANHWLAGQAAGAGAPSPSDATDHHEGGEKHPIGD